MASLGLYEKFREPHVGHSERIQAPVTSQVQPLNEHPTPSSDQLGKIIRGPNLSMDFGLAEVVAMHNDQRGVRGRPRVWNNANGLPINYKKYRIVGVTWQRSDIVDGERPNEVLAIQVSGLASVAWNKDTCSAKTEFKRREKVYVKLPNVDAKKSIKSTKLQLCKAYTPKHNNHLASLIKLIGPTFPKAKDLALYKGAKEAPPTLTDDEKAVIQDELRDFDQTKHFVELVKILTPKMDALSKRLYDMTGSEDDVELMKEYHNQAITVLYANIIEPTLKSLNAKQVGSNRIRSILISNYLAQHFDHEYTKLMNISRQLLGECIEPAVAFGKDMMVKLV